MTWQQLQIVRTPTSEITLAAAKDYCRFKQDTTLDDDGVLNAIRAAVPLQLERELNRALFAQRRAYTAVLAGGEVVSGVNLEPHTNLVVTGPRGPVPVQSFGSLVNFSPSYTGQGIEGLRFEYDAGWGALPADLQEAVLYEIMVRYVRRNEAANQSETVRLPKSRPVLSHYRVYPDPVRRSFRIRNLASD